MVPILAAMVAIMYFMMIRPQQKQLKEHRALLGALKKGDEVVTQGGMLGRSTWSAERDRDAGSRQRRARPRAQDFHRGKGAVAGTRAAAAKVEEKKEEK